MKVQTILNVIAAILMGLALVTGAVVLRETTKRTPEQIQRDKDIDFSRRTTRHTHE